MDASRYLKGNIKNQLKAINELNYICQKISQTDCKTGVIKKNKLQIFVKQYEFMRARSSEQEILAYAGIKYKFSQIDWRILPAEKHDKINRVTRESSSSTARQVELLAEKCTSKALKDALTKLGKTLSHNSTKS